MLLKSVLICFVLVCSFSGFSQTAKNEDDLKKQAEKLFENEEYNFAYKLYAQLVSNYPKDPEYNYRLGVCMLYTEPDKKKPFSYLKIATNTGPTAAAEPTRLHILAKYNIVVIATEGNDIAIVCCHRLKKCDVVEDTFAVRTFVYIVTEENQSVVGIPSYAIFDHGSQRLYTTMYITYCDSSHSITTS